MDLLISPTSHRHEWDQLNVWEIYLVAFSGSKVTRASTTHTCVYAVRILYSSVIMLETTARLLTWSGHEESGFHQGGMFTELSPPRWG